MHDRRVVQLSNYPTILILPINTPLPQTPAAMADQTDTAASSSFDAEFLFQQARGYLAFGEQISKFSQQFHDNVQNGADWGAVLRQNFDRFKTAIAESADGPGANPDLARLWTETLDLWQRTAASLGVVAPEGEVTDAWLAYRQVQNQYLDMLRQAAKAALDLMEQQLSERAVAGKTIDSLRELYNLWVDCNEKTYGQMLRGTEYSELSGRLFNALLRCYPQGVTAR